MNVFFVIGDKVITPLLDGTILEGITRNSCIKLLQNKGYTVEERKISVDEIVDASNKGVLKDAFGTGTAAIVAKIAAINYKGVDYKLPNPEEREVSNYLYKTLGEIQTGLIPDNFNWIERVN
jgi:branched-chain amino acid aminotransferase